MKDAIGFGALIGGLAVAYKIVEQVTERKLGAQTLDPPTSALHTNSELTNLYIQLEEYRYVNNRAYVSANTNGDRFVMYYNNCLENPTSEDLKQLYTFYGVTFDAIEDMVRKGNPRESAEIQLIYESLYDLFHGMLGNIVNICYETGKITRQSRENRRRIKKRAQKSK